MQYCTAININKNASIPLDLDGDCFIVLLYRTSQSMRKGKKKTRNIKITGEIFVWAKCLLKYFFI